MYILKEWSYRFLYDQEEGTYAWLVSATSNWNINQNISFQKINWLIELMFRLQYYMHQIPLLSRNLMCPSDSKFSTTLNCLSSSGFCEVSDMLPSSGVVLGLWSSTDLVFGIYEWLEIAFKRSWARTNLEDRDFDFTPDTKKSIGTLSTL